MMCSAVVSVGGDALAYISVVYDPNGDWPL